MALTEFEREVITDSMLKIQSVEASLDQIHGVELIGIDDIRSCLRSANENFREVLRSARSKKPTKH